MNKYQIYGDVPDKEPLWLKCVALLGTNMSSYMCKLYESYGKY